MLCVVERARRMTLDFAFGWERSPGTAQIRRGVILPCWRTGLERFPQCVSV